MKAKRMKNIFIIFVLIATVVELYFVFPRRFVKSYEGLKYSLGDTKKQEKVKISLKGNLRKNFMRPDSFTGEVVIGNVVLANAFIDIDGKSNVLYKAGAGAGTDFKAYGTAYANEGLQSLSITVYDDEKGWSSNDGAVISAPASNRNEAIEVSNKLMKDVLIKSLQ